MKTIQLLIFLFIFPSGFVIAQSVPCLEKKGESTRLTVNGKPFLILGGELGNSNASDAAFMKSIWTKAKNLNINTVLMPVYWELIEPVEGKFDYSLTDSLISDARKHGLKLVLLWFGAYKNSMSCYAPLWVKKDIVRFPRSVDTTGRGVEILSPFSSEVLKADLNAFTSLLTHLKKTDSQENTVIMIQVENEIGMLPQARDMSVAATEKYHQPVPSRLLKYLEENQSDLQPFLKKRTESGSKKEGTWEEVFGKGIETEEIFMAWYFGEYVEKLAESGKNIYPLPMYVNAALNRPGRKPGEYPSAGPLPHLMDIWKAAAPYIDFLAPDIYFSDFENWCTRYDTKNNPLFIPENRLEESNGVQAMYVIGQHNAIGYSPFWFELMEDEKNSNLSQSYGILSELTPLILEKQQDGLTRGVLLDSISDRDSVKLNGYILYVRHEKDWLKPAQPVPSHLQKAGCIIIATGDNEFIIAGNSVLITFTPDSPGLPVAGIGETDEIFFKDGKMIKGRRLNGDQTHQGRHIHLPSDSFGIQKVKLYRYE